jgi:hypothetical protein
VACTEWLRAGNASDIHFNIKIDGKYFSFSLLADRHLKGHQQIINQWEMTKLIYTSLFKAKTLAPFIRQVSATIAKETDNGHCTSKAMQCSTTPFNSIRTE